MDEYDGLLTNNRIWEKRTLGICVITPEDALDYGLSGPNIRGSGIKWDLRKDRPYLTYPKYSFDVPVGKTGDVYDRYLVRLEEMRQSREICVQALKNISPRGEFRTADRKISPPPEGGARTEHGGAHPPFPPLHAGIRAPGGRGLQHDRIGPWRVGDIPRFGRIEQTVSDARPRPLS